MAKQKLNNRHIKRFAKHEAGHALHHVLNFRHKFEFVWVRRTDDEPIPLDRPVNNTSADGRLGGAVFCPPNQQIYCTTFEVVANCMAGIAGERINRKNPGKLGFVDILMGAEGDWRMAQHFIRESNEKGLSKWVITDEDKYMDKALKYAHGQLQAFRSPHEEITRLLIERGRLSYDEVIAIVYRNPESNNG